jgi:hypothetical protein
VGKCKLQSQETRQAHPDLEILPQNQENMKQRRSPKLQTPEICAATDNSNFEDNTVKSQHAETIKICVEVNAEHSGSGISSKLQVP